MESKTLIRQRPSNLLSFTPTFHNGIGDHDAQPISAALIGAALAALPAAAQEPIDRAMLARIKDEGLQRSRAQGLYFALSRMGSEPA